MFKNHDEVIVELMAPANAPLETGRLYGASIRADETSIIIELFNGRIIRIDICKSENED